MRPLSWGGVDRKEIGRRAWSAGDARCAMLRPRGIKDTFELVKHEILAKNKKVKHTLSVSKYNISFNHL